MFQSGTRRDGPERDRSGLRENEIFDRFFLPAGGFVLDYRSVKSVDSLLY